VSVKPDSSSGRSASSIAHPEKRKTTVRKQ
jgi:hypothetical protein